MGISIRSKKRLELTAAVFLTRRRGRLRLLPQLVQRGKKPFLQSQAEQGKRKLGYQSHGRRSLGREKEKGTLRLPSIRSSRQTLTEESNAFPGRENLDFSPTWEKRSFRSSHKRERQHTLSI